ncbi:hypothetical protein BV22DRAFT_633511 [Leucogyrophana mollusca]|uniref:Uncharacterized protein n=1 Tax=Leucogyrophana mollusca TaxID=85980 RepID=A0ACB8BAG4_9AGAM|nr:hypothetical protein BV22DRAFT_633511 [Leucogyrophana mollusca]
MAFLPLFRTIVFGVSVFCSFIVLGLSGHLVSPTEGYTFAGLGVATAVLTLLTMPAMFIIDFLRQGTFTSMVVVELSWLCMLHAATVSKPKSVLTLFMFMSAAFLWILWIATAGTAVGKSTVQFPLGCSNIAPDLTESCNEIAAVEAFSFIAFFLLIAYTGVVLTFAIIATSRGNNIWFTSVKEVNLTAPATGGPTQQHSLSQYPASTQQSSNYTSYAGVPAPDTSAQPVAQV